MKIQWKNLLEKKLKLRSSLDLGEEVHILAGRLKKKRFTWVIS